MALRNPGNRPQGNGAKSIRLQRQAWEMWVGRFQPPTPDTRRRFFHMPPEALRCKECKTEYPLEARYVCEQCFGPLEVRYASRAGLDPDEMKRTDPGRAVLDLALRGFPARRESAIRARRRVDAAGPRRPARGRTRDRRAVDQERRREPHPLVQGSGRLGCARPGHRSSATPRSRAPRPATSQTPSPPTPRPPDSSRSSSSPRTSRSRRCSPRASTGPIWCPSRATTTTSTDSAPSSPASTSGPS